MNYHHSMAIGVAAAVAVFIGYQIVNLSPAPAPKGNKLTTAHVTAPPEPPSPAPPAATTLPGLTILAIPEPVAAGPAPVELRPTQAVQARIERGPSNRRTKKARRIAKAKAEPCVGPLCVLVR